MGNAQVSKSPTSNFSSTNHSVASRINKYRHTFVSIELIVSSSDMGIKSSNSGFKFF